MTEPTNTNRPNKPLIVALAVALPLGVVLTLLSVFLLAPKSATPEPTSTPVVIGQIESCGGVLANPDGTCIQDGKPSAPRSTTYEQVDWESYSVDDTGVTITTAGRTFRCDYPVEAVQALGGSVELNYVSVKVESDGKQETATCQFILSNNYVSAPALTEPVVIGQVESCGGVLANPDGSCSTENKPTPTPTPEAATYETYPANGWDSYQGDTTGITISVAGRTFRCDYPAEIMAASGGQGVVPIYVSEETTLSGRESTATCYFYAFGISASSPATAS